MTVLSPVSVMHPLRGRLLPVATCEVGAVPRGAVTWQRKHSIIHAEPHFTQSAEWAKSSPPQGC